MSLRAKSLLIFSTTWFGLISAFYLIAAKIYLREFHQIEQSNIHQNLESVLKALIEDQKALDRLAQDYANRDDVYGFILDGQFSSIENTFSANTYASYQLSLVAFINASGKLIYGSEFDLISEKQNEISGNLIQDITTVSSFFSPVNSQPKVLQLLGKPMLVSVQPILSKPKKDSSLGWLILGRILDMEIYQISRQIGLPVIWASWETEKIDLPSDMKLAQDDLQKIVAGPGESPISTKPLNEQSIAGYTFLRDLHGEPAYLIRVDYPRTIYQQGKASLQSLLITLVATGLGFLLVGMLLLEKSILAPVVKKSTTINNIGESRSLDTSLPLAGRDEIASLAYSINRMLLEALEQRCQELAKRYLQSHTVEKAALTAPFGGANQLINAEPGFKQLLSQTIRLVVERSGYANASIYLLDSSKEYAVLVETTHEGNNLPKADEIKFAVGSPTMVGWVVANNKPRIAVDVTRDPFCQKDEKTPDTRSEIVIPISVGDLVFGALDVQSHKPNDFQRGDVTVLQAMANQLATAIHNIRLLESTQLNLEETFILNQASWYISQAETTEDILQAVNYALRQTPYQTAIYSIHPTHLGRVSRKPNLSAKSESPAESLFSQGLYSAPNTAPDRLDVTGKEVESLLASQLGSSRLDPFLIIDDANITTLPTPLIQLLQQWQCKEGAIIPVIWDNQLVALFVVGFQGKNLNPDILRPYTILAELITRAFQRIQALTKIKKSLEESRILNAVSQSLSVQTDLNIIYQEIHNAIIQFMGQVDFLIALYDSEENKIQIPYMWEGNGFLTVEPFPLGEGLTSILIRSRQPLMIVEDTENQAKALGALVVGKPAKSWLGAPLIAGDEVIGAIVVQDTEHEHRFTEEDQRLLSTLATQVAASIRNIFILEKTRLQANREQWIREVTSKIRGSVDMHSILATTATELGKALKTRRVHIQVDIDQRDKAP